MCVWDKINYITYYDIGTDIQIPPGFSALEDSCWLEDLLRLWFFFLPPAALTERSNTPLALKKATRKGCLDWGPFLPTIPADLMLILRPLKTTDSKLNFQIKLKKKLGRFIISWLLSNVILKSRTFTNIRSNNSPFLWIYWSLIGGEYFQSTEWQIYKSH